jgi:hypothetical protein
LHIIEEGPGGAEIVAVLVLLLQVLSAGSALSVEARTLCGVKIFLCVRFDKRAVELIVFLIWRLEIAATEEHRLRKRRNQME